MIQITPQMRIWVAVEPVDFRRGIDGLAQLCRQTLQQDPFSGALFVFRNRSGTAVKVLMYDGQGYWLCHKRLSSGRFRWWPNGVAPGTSDHTATAARRTLAVPQLQALLWAGDPEGSRAAPAWRSITPA
jgi:transposase